jgi:hypothetical protein
MRYFIPVTPKTLTFITMIVTSKKGQSFVKVDKSEISNGSNLAELF